jgi:hypothetical protein
MSGQARLGCTVRAATWKPHQGTATGLFAERTTSVTTRANQPRLWFVVVAYVPLNYLRHSGFCDSNWTAPRFLTIRTRLLKIGAQIRVSVIGWWLP